MLSDRSKDRVWIQYYDAERFTRYYETLSNRYMWYSTITRFVLLGSVLSSIGSILELLPDWVPLLSDSLIGVTIIIEFIGNFARKSAILHMISVKCHGIRNELKQLFDEIDTPDIDASDILLRSNELSKLLLDTTAMAGPAEISIATRLNTRCAKDAKQVLENEYGE